MPERERPVAEVFRLKGEEWAEAASDAYIAEKLKDTVYERLRQQVFDEALREGDKISLNEAGRRVTMSEAWEQHIIEVGQKKRKADDLWVKRKAIEIAHEDIKNRDSNLRHDKQLSRG
jgi:hypothetical protein